jgi:hypothetical protein
MTTKQNLTDSERYAILRDLFAREVIRIDMYKFPWARVTDLDKLVDESAGQRQEAA